MPGTQALWWLAASAGLALLVAVTPAPARAHGRVIIGGSIGVPLYPYPPPPYVYPYPAPWGYYDPAPPPGWVPSHWEWEYDRRGKPYRVWVPGHLR